LISGNGLGGIQLAGESGGQNVITANLIGTDVTGNAALPNLTFGIRILNSGNIIGTPEPGHGNVISGNRVNGIEMFSSLVLFSSNNTIQNNNIGVGLDPDIAIPNNAYGIRNVGGSGNTIGGGPADASNIIAWNNLSGIVLLSRTVPDTLEPATGNNMRNNRIFGNNGLGIDIDIDGPTENDTDGSTNGTNRRQNYPEIQSFNAAGHTITLTYRIPTDPDFAGYPIDVDFYIPDDFGQGKFPVHTDTWTEADFPDAKQITFTLSTADHPDYEGRPLTATATDQGGNTSEFAPVENLISASERLTLIHEFPDQFNALGVYGERDIWLVAGNKVAISADAGETWNEVSTPTLDMNYTLSGIHLLDAETAWVYGSGGAVFKTSDGGDNWSLQSTGNISFIRHIYFADDQSGWLVHNNGLVFRSANGGETWDEQTITNGVFYTSVHFLNLDTAWLLGLNNSIGRYLVRRTTDGGETWSDYVFGENVVLTSIHFMDAERGWAAGQAGRLFSTTDGGNSWHQSEPFTTSNLNAVYFGDENSGWLGGRSQELLGTSDGGNSWTTEPTGVLPGGQVLGIQPTGTGFAFALVRVFGQSYLFRFEAGTEVSVPGHTELPAAHRLDQNYPNPFNPTTNIVFELPEASDVRLEVFSIDGRRVTTLLDNRLDAGRHVVPYDASALASGVYLYRITSGTFIQTRKMILIK
ncbi:MAG: T9SS C-terminal target domain-containing protein, partial [Balneolaceae bacterium]